MSSKITVFLTVFNRINKLQQTLEKLEKQTFVDFDIVIINNNTDQEVINEVNRIVSESPNSLNITVKHQIVNLGTMIRFKIAADNGCDYAVFLDDDMTIGKEMMEIFNKEKEPQSLKSIVGINFQDTFEVRKRANPTKPAKILGPGAMIADASLFRDPEFWKLWRPEFYVIDDLWVSYYAHMKGWKLVVSESKVFLNPSDKNSMLRNQVIQGLKMRFTELYKW